jgi:hypothetical protein
MASEDKKSKTTPAPKTETAKKDAVAPKEKASAAAEPAKAESTKADSTKAESSEPAAAAPKSYSRGEGQKPVSQAYKDNWNAIFGKKTKKKKKR